MKKRLIAFFILALIVSAAPIAYGGEFKPSDWPEADQDKFYQKVHMGYLCFIDKLSQEQIDFVTREALACRLTLSVRTLEGNTIAQHRWWKTGGITTREIAVSELSTWEAVNIENLVHELAHAGASGTGNDDRGYDKKKEVNARKREAESWKNASNKPPRDAGADQGCWATYDMVFAATGLQRTHDFIKSKLKGYNYPQKQM